MTIGLLDEIQSFLSSTDELSEEIRNYRKYKLGGVLADHEEVLHYQKRIIFDNKQISHVHQNIFAVKDIFRLNIKPYISRLDNPIHRAYFLDKSGQVSPMEVPKVYYIDLIMSYSQRSNGHQYEHIALECKRLIVNKKGLVRIEG